MTNKTDKILNRVFPSWGPPDELKAAIVSLGCAFVGFMAFTFFVLWLAQ
jgi:hypothetical protein